MVGLVHLVQRFTVPFASHTRARIIRCESPPLCPHHWSFLTAYPTLYKFHLRLRFPTDRISESASAKWKRRQWRDPIGLEFLLLFVGEAKRKSSAHDSGLLSFATFSSWLYTFIYYARVCEAKGTVNLCTKCTNVRWNFGSTLWNVGELFFIHAIIGLQSL